MASNRPPPLKEVPEVVINQQNGERFFKGRFMGKGGFARCYELTNMSTKEIWAGKIVSKTLLVKKHQKDKMAQEVAIHRTLSHPHVVRLRECFEDTDNVYILLELCSKRSLMELHKRRRAVTEPEARYFTYQVVDACVFLHDRKIIHRDLKLGNLFLNEQMMVKIGDFGLATTLDYDGERKKTLCGTPNYIAPEMLGKKGHSFEVDIWAIGCILYTLLIGKPPFETQSLKDTYTKIRKNEYHIPSKIGPHATHLIQRLLAADPSGRPTIRECIQFDFFTHGYMPTRLPASCLTMAPKFPSTTQLRAGIDSTGAEVPNRQPFAVMQQQQQQQQSTAHRMQQYNTHVGSTNQMVAGGAYNQRGPSNAALIPSQGGYNDQQMTSPRAIARRDVLAAPVRQLNTVPESGPASIRGSQGGGDSIKNGTSESSEVPTDYYLADLYGQLTKLLASRPDQMPRIQQEDAEDPRSVPVFWISKWVDYSDKYGLGYQLCDNSVGVLFNDSSKLVLDEAGRQVTYVEKDNNERYFTINDSPATLEKKMTLLKYFRNYMNEHLLKAGEGVQTDGDELARLPCLRTWFRTRSAIVLHLNNGTLQVNFFQDHSKVIVCPLMGAVSYIDDKRNFHTYKLSELEKSGCEKDLLSRIKYVRTMVERLLSQSSSSRPGKLSTHIHVSGSAATA